jgi:anti-anti-sigma factor
MKRHRTAAGIRLVARNERGVMQAAANRSDTVHKRSAPTQSRARKPSLTLAGTGVRTHTLVLTGELDRRSAPMLEAEIERLYEEGVTGLTLDLRELTYIDATGIAVIVFRCGLCKRRGQDLALIPGSRFMQHAFEQAGVSDLRPFRENRITTPSSRGAVRHESPHEPGVSTIPQPGVEPGSSA